MNQIEKIKLHADALRLTQTRNNPEGIIHEAQINKPTYMEFLLSVFECEIKHREKKNIERRIALANLPKDHDLDKYDFNASNGITPSHLKQLRELMWMEQNYNLILMGPSGTGKTFIAAGLIYDAVNTGYKAYFITMEELIKTLKMKEMISSALAKYNRLLKANIIAIDDIMLFPIKKEDAVSFFNLINHLHEQTSVIITTNKSPKEWAETLEDEVLATALLDRLLYRCEVVKMKGQSFRMENRRTIFEPVR
ncbi:IS21-like element helper ATPase IstB [Halosquirtibacter laminarini]|uniref:IS21-like element helper ATPase IstB n=4 Tax=Halosquirtibacter laminarini TaxID=3374600 RepID=A0AC61NR02_9BACT|nr:IS21-like element helper ATPase IstB [Prolixibacteraceae bacterium]QZE13929.1 IS21-like element helper ATPase IstB [Prolixibacteraceae bacterium]QZE14196.1 IS21-like element helper ATPase IstB [Prolixibacteraceae bacterium]QZE15530.1 IS21-like element helper ATPase IstB [Prolixibacteraceae bacterium]